MPSSTTSPLTPLISTQSHAVAAHEHEPADEGNDEVLERDCEAGAGNAEHGAQLPRDPDQDKEDQQHADDLQCDADDAAQRLRLPSLDVRTPEQPAQPAVGEQQQ